VVAVQSVVAVRRNPSSCVAMTAVQKLPCFSRRRNLREAKRGEKIYSIPKQRTGAIAYIRMTYIYVLDSSPLYVRPQYLAERTASKKKKSRRRLLTCFPFPVSRLLVDRGHPRVHVDSISCTHANFRLLCPEKHARNQTRV
jgi:hypothetical protein